MLKRLTLSSLFTPVVHFHPCSRKILQNFLPNLTFSRTFHFTPKRLEKIFVDGENAFAHQILPVLPLMRQNFNTYPDISNEKDFEELLLQNWRSAPPSDIVKGFVRAKTFSINHGIPLSDNRYDNLVDGLMDNCEKLTDEELLTLLETIREYPQCQYITSHNFHDVWSCLDDICCWKMGGWSLDKTFAFVTAWFKLNLARLSDFVPEVLDRLPRKAKRFTKKELLYTYFCINVCRKKEVEFAFEDQLCREIDNFNVDELAVIAMGYFKAQTKVKLKPILAAMIEKAVENASSVNEITLAAILKTLRLSQNYELVDQVRGLLDRIVPEIPRLSPQCCLHIALLSTGLQIKHEHSLQAATEKILQNIKNARIKDIERIVMVNSMFNLNPENLYDTALSELKSRDRQAELIQYPRCLGVCLQFLSLRNIYCYELMDKILNEEYINEIYGKSGRQVPQQLFSLDCSIDVECPGYKGNRLSIVKRYKAAKWLSEFIPDYKQYKKLTMSDKFYLEVVENLKCIVGENNILNDHVLPHFCRPDVVVCREKNSGNFVEPFGFHNYILGDVKKPFDIDNYRWYVFVILIPNIMVRNSSEPLGSVLMKERQLKKLGYEPIFVAWNDFGTLPSKEEKIDFLRRQIAGLNNV